MIERRAILSSRYPVAPRHEPVSRNRSRASAAQLILTAGDMGSPTRIVADRRYKCLEIILSIVHRALENVLEANSRQRNSEQPRSVPFPSTDRRDTYSFTELRMFCPHSYALGVFLFLSKPSNHEIRDLFLSRFQFQCPLLSGSEHECSEKHC